MKNLGFAFLTLCSLLLVSPEGQAITHTNLSVRMMTQKPQGLPSRCSVTRVSLLTFATAGHCIHEALNFALAGALRINIQASASWLDVTAIVNPEYAANIAVGISTSDAGLFFINEADTEKLQEVPIFPPCENPPSPTDVLRGSSQWFGTNFDATLDPRYLNQMPTRFSVNAQGHRRFRGLTHEESGGGLFQVVNGKTCWCASEANIELGNDFSLNASYSGINALLWVKANLR
jgi:hypothetical protein